MAYFKIAVGSKKQQPLASKSCCGHHLGAEFVIKHQGTILGQVVPCMLPQKCLGSIKSMDIISSAISAQARTQHLLVYARSILARSNTRSITLEVNTLK